MLDNHFQGGGCTLEKRRHFTVQLLPQQTVGADWFVITTSFLKTPVNLFAVVLTERLGPHTGKHSCLHGGMYAKSNTPPPRSNAQFGLPPTLTAHMSTLEPVRRAKAASAELVHVNA